MLLRQRNYNLQMELRYFCTGFRSKIAIFLSLRSMINFCQQSAPLNLDCPCLGSKFSDDTSDFHEEISWLHVMCVLVNVLAYRESKHFCPYRTNFGFLLRVSGIAYHYFLEPLSSAFLSLMVSHVFSVIHSFFGALDVARLHGMKV